jgi:hypothetical protein
MLVYKDPTNNRLAIILGDVVFFSTLEGQIYKRIEILKFDSDPFTEETTFPRDYAEAEAEYWDMDIDEDKSKYTKFKEDMSKSEQKKEFASVKRVDIDMAY